MKWAALISLAAHAAAITLICAWISRPHQSRRPQAPKSKPISVALIPLPPPAHRAPAQPASKPPGARAEIQSRWPPARKLPPEAPARKSPRGPGPSPLSMRTPPPGRRGENTPLPPLAPTGPATAGPAPAPPPPLNPLGPITAPRPPGPRPERQKFGPTFHGSGGGSYKSDRGPFTAKIDRNGHMHFHDKRNLQAHFFGPFLVGGFDLTDWAMRHAGMDPYSYRKMKLLDATRAQREQMAQAAQREDLRAAVRVTPKYLRAIWRTQTWPYAKRRWLIFQLWDECAERGPHDVVAAANEVRATIIGFIRRALPAGSPHAYTAAELRALNAHRASKQRFAPYGDAHPRRR